MLDKRNKNNFFILNFTLIIVLVYWLFYILYIWQSLIIPFFIAILFAMAVLWLANFYKKMKIHSFFAMTLSFLTYFFIFYYIWTIISSNINDLIILAPSYQEEIILKMKQSLDYFWVEETQVLKFFSSISLKDIFNSISSTLLSLSSSIWTILFYMVFILLEVKYFDKKIELMLPDKEKRWNLFEVLHKIQDDVKWYFYIKVIVSFLTAFVSYIIMLFFWLDFSIFWALVIFILNFVPNIGSIIAILFPALLSFIQPDFWPYASFFMTLFLIIVQMIVWNVVEPKMMWNKLNLSPLVIIISLSFWGYLWGIIGMLLSVPLMVIINIILSKFEQTRPIAIFLSEKWDVQVFSNDEKSTIENKILRKIKNKFI